MAQPVPPVSLQFPPRPGFSPKRFFMSLGGFILFAIASSFALLTALGFRVNGPAHVIQRTGIVEVQSPYNVPADVRISGSDEVFTLPVRIPWLLPGNYTVTITRDGYVPWIREVSLGQNQRISFSSIVLLYITPKTAELPTLSAVELLPTQADQGGLEVRNGNEIWINKEFVTRISGDILNIRWFPGREHIVYQTENALVLADVDGKYTQTILSGLEKSTLPYTFRESGRVLIYQVGTEVKAVSLFEHLSFIDRLTPER